MEAEVIEALSALEPVWDGLYPADRADRRCNRPACFGPTESMRPRQTALQRGIYPRHPQIENLLASRVPATIRSWQAPTMVGSIRPASNTESNLGQGKEQVP